MKKHLTENKSKVSRRFNFQSFGVKIGICSDKSAYIKEAVRYLERIFTDGFQTIEEDEVEYLFYIKETEKRGLSLDRNEECVIEGVLDKTIFFEMLESQIRVTIAEFAVSKVFLHAGVVSWKGQAIVIPAQSFSGKSTLVAELIKKGALYYSDEYAVLDSEGNVEPFPKWLSLRGIIDDYRQLDCTAESIGGKVGTETLPVGMVLLARYDKQKKMPNRWRPKRLSKGAAVMEILPHTLPIRNNPKFVLEVLNKLTTHAIIVKTVRGEAGEFAETLLKYFERRAILDFQTKL